MKTILLLLVTAVTFGQTNLIIDQNMTIGQNCGQGQPSQTLTVQDLNFNGNYTLTLKGINLVVLGNVNGTGTITNFCNNVQSTACYNGWYNGNVTTNGITLVNCSSLSTPIFNPVTDIDLEFYIYNTIGRLERHGRTSSRMYEELEKGFYVVHVVGFKPFKHIVQ